MSEYTAEELNSADQFYGDQLLEEEKMVEAGKRRIADMRALLETPEGRRTFFWVCNLDQLFESEFTNDVNGMYYLSGRRSLIKEVLQLVMAADPDIFAAFIRDGLLNKG